MTWPWLSFCRSEKGFCALNILRFTVAWEDGKSYLLNGLSRELLVLFFHLRVLCTCLVLQFLCFCHGPYPFCTCCHPTQTLPDMHQITVPYQSVWSWLVHGFSLDTVHACGYIDYESLRGYHIQYMMTILSPRYPPLETPCSRLSTVGTRKTWRSCLTRSHPEWVQVRLRWSFLGELC